MVICVKTPLKNAQQVKGFLIDKKIFNSEFRFKKTRENIFLPISSPIRSNFGIKKRFPFVELVDVKALPKSRKTEDMLSIISKQLTKTELKHLRRAYDVIGDIAILEVPPELVKKQKIIAETLLKTHKNIKTVLKKAGIHGTEFRTQPMQWLAGKKTKETIHREHGILLKLDVERVYFSPRLSTERNRIAQQVKSGERVLVMFSGCAPYPCVIAKNTDAKEIVGIEVNPLGHDYGVENIKINNLSDVVLINADVKDAIPMLKTTFDRIIMPLPKTAEDFLDLALSVSKKGTIIHFYNFRDLDRFKEASELIKATCKRKDKKCRILRTVKCGKHSPSKYRVCVDFKII